MTGKRGRGRNSVLDGNLERFSQNLLQFRSSFTLDRICLLRREVAVRGEPQECEMAGADGEKEKGLMEKVHSAPRKDSYTGSKDSWSFHSLQGLERRHSHAPLRKDKELQSQLPPRKFPLLGRRKMFFTVQVGEPQDRLSGEPTDLYQGRSSNPAWVSPENLPGASPASWGCLTRSFPILIIPGFKASPDIRRWLQRKEKN